MGLFMSLSGVIGISSEKAQGTLMDCVARENGTFEFCNTITLEDPDTGIIKAELVELPSRLKFKKLREEKIEKAGEEIAKKKKVEKEKVEAEQPEIPAEKKTEEEKKEEKEKAEAGAEATKKMEKAAAKQLKHQAGGKTKQPKRQVRKALEK